MLELARVIVRGSGLLVTHATPAAEAVTQRPLLGIPLIESMWEPAYGEVLDVIRRSVVGGVALTEIVRAPNGDIGRVTADPVTRGACVTFVPTESAVQHLYGPDLIMGCANDVWQQLASSRPYLGIAAREGFPEPEYAEAQEAMARVMRTGEPIGLWVLSGRMRILRTGRGIVTTSYRPPRVAPPSRAPGPTQ